MVIAKPPLGKNIAQSKSGLGSFSQTFVYSLFIQSKVYRRRKHEYELIQS